MKKERIDATLIRIIRLRYSIQGSSLILEIPRLEKAKSL